MSGRRQPSRLIRVAPSGPRGPQHGPLSCQRPVPVKSPLASLLPLFPAMRSCPAAKLFPAASGHRDGLQRGGQPPWELEWETATHRWSTTRTYEQGRAATRRAVSAASTTASVAASPTCPPPAIVAGWRTPSPAAIAPPCVQPAFVAPVAPAAQASTRQATVEKAAGTMVASRELNNPDAAVGHDLQLVAAMKLTSPTGKEIQGCSSS